MAAVRRDAGGPPARAQQSRRLLRWYGLCVGAVTAVGVGGALLGWTPVAVVAQQVDGWLGLPALMLFGASFYCPTMGVSTVTDTVVMAVPAVLVLFACVSTSAARRQRDARRTRVRADRDTPGPEPRPQRAASPVLAPVLAVVLGVVIGVGAWVGWLSGWVPWYSVAPAHTGDSGNGPYTLTQHLGYAATLVIAAFLLGLALNPFAVAAGLTAGFWACWTAWVLQQDSPFWALSSMLVLLNVGLPTLFSALLGYGLRPTPVRAKTRGQRTRHRSPAVAEAPRGAIGHTDPRPPRPHGR